MKNFNYHGGSLKNPICRGGHEKAIYRGNNCLKMGGGGTWTNWKDKIITISLLSFPKKVTQ